MFDTKGDRYKFVIDEIRERGALESVREEWNAMVREQYSPNLCSTYEWLTSWWDAQRAAGRRLLVLVIKDGLRTVGIIPFMTVRERFFFLPTVTIEFISTARYADSPANVSLALDFLLRERWDEILKTVLDYLTGHEERWHVIRLNPIPAHSPTIPVLREAAGEMKLPFRCREVFSNVSVPIKVGWEEYYPLLSKSFRKSLSHNERTLQEEGPIHIQTLSTEDEIISHFPVIMDIERRSWKWNVGISINSAAFNDFYERFARIAGKRGWIRLWLLQVNNKYIAYDYNILFDNSVINLKGSYDAEYQECSPGNLLLASEIEDAFRNGMKSFNMLWDLTMTKRRWIPTVEPHFEIFIFRNSLYGAILHRLYFSLSLYGIRRRLLEYRNRLFRKLNIRWKNSELTRIDQIERHDPDTGR